MFKLTLIAVGNNMPTWVAEGTQEYAKRFAPGIQLKIIEIPLLRRNKSSHLGQIRVQEAALIQAALPSNAQIIALTIEGQAFTSEGLAQKITQLQQLSSHLCLLIGGPEGFLPETLSLCHHQWSLSKLTLPHPLVRIILLEALYRAWAIITNHPYHK